MSNHRSRFRDLWLFTCFTSLSLALSLTDCQGVIAQEVPSWKTGVSNWTGLGYSVPPVPTPSSLATTATNPTTSPSAIAATPKTSTTKPRYTVPVDTTAVVPASSTEVIGPDLSWLENFATSNTVVAPEQIRSAKDPNPVTQVAAQEMDLILPIPTPIPDPIIPVPSITDPTITEQINAPAGVAEELPLQNEVVRWYYYPWQWLTQGWTNHAELGLDGSEGNARTLALTTGIELKRKTDIYTLAIDLDYRKATNRDEITQDNGRFNIDYDRILGASDWTAFGKFGLEWDRFKAFDLRVNTNAGVGYYWVRNDATTFITRFGAGASREIGAPDDSWTPEAVFGFEGERQLTARQKIKAKLDYFPAWDDFSDFRLVADASWEILLDGTDNLSLKLALTDRYDSTPQGALANDVYYSALILYKF